MTDVQSAASAAHSNQTQITRSSHCGRAPRGMDSIERHDSGVTRDFNIIAFFCARQSGPKFLDPPFSVRSRELIRAGP